MRSVLPKVLAEEFCASACPTCENNAASVERRTSVGGRTLPKRFSALPWTRCCLRRLRRCWAVGDPLPSDSGSSYSTGLSERRQRSHGAFGWTTLSSRPRLAVSTSGRAATTARCTAATAAGSDKGWIWSGE